MLDVPADAMYVWVGASTTSIVILGVVLALPAGTPPVAADVARAVDSVSVALPGSTSTYPIRASDIRIGPHRVGLRGTNGASHATFAYGPVTPVGTRAGLESVLRGATPGLVFDGKSGFQRAIRKARSGIPSWNTAPSELTMRRVKWGEVNATLVG